MPTDKDGNLIAPSLLQTESEYRPPANCPWKQKKEGSKRRNPAISPNFPHGYKVVNLGPDADIIAT